MTRIIPIQNLPTGTREFLARIAPNDEIIIEEAGRQLARITTLPAKAASKPARRPLGIWKDKVWIAPDFDAELPAEFWTPAQDPLTS